MKKLINFFKQKKEYSANCWWQSNFKDDVFGRVLYITPEISITYDPDSCIDTSDTGDCSQICFRFNWLLFNSYFTIYFNLHKDYKKWK